MKLIRHIGSLAFVLGVFCAVFFGIPWYVMVADDPVLPWWLKTAIFCLLGGILVVLLTVALEQRNKRKTAEDAFATEFDQPDLLLTSTASADREISEILGLVQGHTMMGRARDAATKRMVTRAADLGADAVINIRYMTTSVVGSAAELLVYGTAVKLGKASP
jgi:uncharacterized protein YbjQ (UPF0145 family)